MEIDEAAFVEKIPYSKAIKDMWKIAPAATIIGYIMLSYQIINTMVVGHNEDPNMLPGLGLG